MPTGREQSVENQDVRLDNILSNDRNQSKCVTMQLATVIPLIVPRSFIVLPGNENIVCFEFYIPESPDESTLPSKFDEIILE